MTALTLEEYPTIDLRLLRRQGFLAPGAEGTLRWFLGPRPIGSTPFAMGQHDLTLVYRLREAGSGKRHEHVEAVSVLRIPQAFGGSASCWSVQAAGGVARCSTAIFCSGAASASERRTDRSTRTPPSASCGAPRPSGCVSEPLKTLPSLFRSGPKVCIGTPICASFGNTMPRRKPPGPAPRADAALAEFAISCTRAGAAVRCVGGGIAERKGPDGPQRAQQTAVVPMSQSLSSLIGAVEVKLFLIGHRFRIGRSRGSSLLFAVGAWPPHDGVRRARRLNLFHDLAGLRRQVRDSQRDRKPPETSRISPV